MVDSWYDSYLGVVTLVRVMIDGKIKRSDQIMMMSSGSKYQVEKGGYFTPKPVDCDEMEARVKIGFIVTGIKDLSDTKAGDTITHAKPSQQINRYLEFKPSKPVVFCGFVSVDSSEYSLLKDSIAKLELNDSSISYEPENSSALGLGFRCGF